jgi:uncharacterized protein
MKPIFRSSLFALFLVVGQAFGGYLLHPIFSLVHLPIYVVLVLGQVILLIIPSIIYFYVTKLPIRETLRLNPIGILDIIIIMALGIFIQPAAMFIGTLASMFFPNVISKVVFEMNSLPLITKLAVIALTPAICEEITMRGIFLSGYKKVDIKIGALMSGLIFGILHMNMQQFCYAFALGVLLAYLVHITNSIFASMICHFTFNGFQTLLSVFALKMAKIQGVVPGQQDIRSLPMASKVSALVVLFIFAVVFTAIAVALFMALIQINKDRKIKIRNKLTITESVSFGENQESIINLPFFASIIIFAIVLFIR